MKELFAGLAFTVCLGAAGIYFTGWQAAHPHILQAIMAVSLVTTVVLGIGVASAKDAPAGNSGTAVTARIGSQGDVIGQQIVGNTGPVHIGDVHNAAPLPPHAMRDYRAEWINLSRSMRTDCDGRRADWDRNNLLGETWSIKGTNRNMCMAWTRQAGALLLNSPRVSARLSTTVLNEPNDLKRWLQYLKENYRFDLGNTARGVTEDGRVETIQMGSLPDLGEQSAKACIDCSTLET
jgi:hypothetical protein